MLLLLLLLYSCQILSEPPKKITWQQITSRLDQANDDIESIRDVLFCDSRYWEKYFTSVTRLILPSSRSCCMCICLTEHFKVFDPKNPTIEDFNVVPKHQLAFLRTSYCTILSRVIGKKTAAVAAIKRLESEQDILQVNILAGSLLEAINKDKS